MKKVVMSCTALVAVGAVATAQPTLFGSSDSGQESAAASEGGGAAPSDGGAAHEADQESGWYPTEYCMRYRENRKELTTTLEAFEYRQAA